MQIKQFEVGWLVAAGGRVARWGTASICLGALAGALQAAPLNDNFANAQNLDGIVGSFSGTNNFSTLEPGEPIHASVTGGASVWFLWTAPVSGKVVFTTSGSNTTFDTILAAYTGTAVSGLTPITADNDSGAGSASQITFSVVAGTAYRIAVDGFNGAVGTYDLSWSTAGSAGVFGFTASSYQSCEFETSDPPGTTLDRSIQGTRITFSRSGGLTGKVRLTYLVTNITAIDGLHYTVPGAVSNAVLGGVTNSVVFFHGQNSSSFLILPLGTVPNSTTLTLGIRIVDVQLDPTESAAITPPTPDPVRSSSLMAITDATRGVNFLRARSRTEEGVGIARVRVDRGTGVVDDTVTRYRINPDGFGSTSGPNNSGFPTDAGADYATPVTNYVNTTGTIIWASGVGTFDIPITIPDNLEVGFNNEFFIQLFNDADFGPVSLLGTTTTNFITIVMQNQVTAEQPAGSVDPAWNRDYFSGTTPAFNQIPGANNTVLSTAVQPDGRSLFGGDFTSVNQTLVNGIGYNRIVRMNTNGSIDTTFSAGTGPNGSVNAIQLQTDNKILIGGAFSSFASVLRGGVARLNTNGTLDASFNPGVGANGSVRSLAAYTNGANQGRVVVVGDFTSFAGANVNRIVRLNADGSLDSGFDTGTGANGPVHVAKIQLDGKVVIAGNFTAINGVTRNRIARLTSTGGLDLSFDPGAGADGVINAIGFDLGEISLSNTVVNVNRNAAGNAAEDIFDLKFGSNSPPGTIFNGRLTINYDFLMRPDYMNVYLGTNQTPTNLIFQTGLVSFTGTKTISFGPTTNSVIRIVVNEANNTNGQQTLWFYDATLLASTGEVPLGAEKFVIGGEFNNYDVRPSSKIARVNGDGSLDTGFTVGSGADDTVFAIQVDTNNQAVFGGLFTSYNGTRRVGLARLRTDGVLDTGFMDAAYNQFAGLPTMNSPLSQPKNSVRSISLQTDGAMIIGGSFKQVGGGARNTAASGSSSPWGPNVTTPAWITRDDIRNRYNMARIIGGSSSGPGNIGFTQTQYSVDEAAGSAVIILSRTNGAVGQVSAQFATGDRPAGPGSATSGSDYAGLGKTITYATTHGINNDTRRWSDAISGLNTVSSTGADDIFITIQDDGLVEGNEQINLSLDLPASGMFLGGEFIPLGVALGNSTATLTIIDDDLPPTFVGFSTNSFTVDENAGSATISVFRTGNTEGSVSVNYQTLNGSAIAGVDYTAVFGSLTFGTGETNRTFSIPINNDSAAEFDETVQLVLTSLSAGASFLTNGNQATLTIFDNDFASGQLRFSATNYSVAENAGSVEITVQRTGGNLGAVTAQIFTFNGTATAPADYGSVSNTLNWANGDTTPRIITVPVVADGSVGGPEDFFVQLTNAQVVANGTPVPVVGTNPVPVVILDSDAYGTLQFASAGFSINENGGAALITVTRLGGSSGVVQASFATENGTAFAGTNYVTTNGTLTLGPGVTSANFAVEIIDDPTQNPGPDFNRTAFVSLNSFSNANVVANMTNLFASALPGSPTNALLTIIDDENVNEPAGSVDTGYNASAGADGFISTLSLQADGRLLIGGDFTRFNGIARKRLARLDAGGTLDSVFNPPGGASDSVRAILAQPDGRVLVGGFFTNVAGTARNRFSRLNVDGTTDSSFEPGAGADGPVFALGQHADAANAGRIIVAGGFTAVNGVNRPFVARLNTNGTVDTGFSTGLGPNAVVFATAVQADGRVLIGGDFVTVDGKSSPRLARLNANGSLDTNFSANLGLGFNDSVRAVLVQTDGRILVGGLFTNFNGALVQRLARLNTDGTADAGFVPNTNSAAGGDNSVLALALQSDGKIIVAGDFQYFSGVTRSRLTRLYANGTVDPAINFGIGANNFIAAGAVQLNDGKILIAGGFTSFNGLARNYLARLYGGVIAGAGQVEFSSPAFTVSEAQTNTVITVRRTGGTTGSISVNYATMDGTAISTGTNMDYLATNGNLVFPNAEVIATFTIELKDDTAVEGNETVNLVLSTNAMSGTTLGNQPVSTLTIVDDDSFVSFSSATYNVNESVSAHVAPITLVRSGGTNGTFMVTLVTSNGTATAGMDYTAVSNTVTFLPGVLSKTINIPISDDVSAEGDETVALSLINVTGAASLTAPNTATLTIVDNEFFPGQLSFLAPAFFVDENATNALITVVRSNGSSGAVTVNFATADGTAMAGTDYATTNGLLFFADGETNKTFLVGIKNDTLIESDETLFVVLSNATGGASLVGANPATLTIINNNEFIFGSFRFASNAFSVSEGAGSTNITVIRTGGTNGTQSVEFGTSDGSAITNQDYLATNGTLVFLPGETSKTFSVQILPDNLVETNETVNLALSNAVGGASIGLPNSALLTIVSTNVRPGDFAFLMPIFSGLENTGPIPITVVRTNGTTGDVSVNVRINNGTAIAGVDYVGTNGSVLTLNWTNGDATPQTFTITPIDNPLVEAPETVMLTLETPVGTMGTPVISSSNGVLVIVDNEVPAGSLDTSFPVSANGIVYGVARDDANLKIVVGGDFTQLNGTARANVGEFDLFGVLDSFSVSGFTLTGGSPSVRAVAVYGPGPQAGKVVAVGQFNSVSGLARTNVVRLNTDGSVDPGFNPVAAPNGVVNAVIANNDGSVILGGAFTQVGTNVRPFLARLASNGTFDGSFSPGSGPDGVVRSLDLQIDGKLVLGGDFTNVANTISGHVARLNLDSTVDTAFSFNLGVGADARVFAVNVDPSGRILVGGAFSNFNNTAAVRLARLKSDGSLDTSFNGLGTGFNDSVLALASQLDGKPIVVGEFTSVNGLPLNRVARLQTNGAVDVSINFGTGANSFVDAVTLQPDGKFVIGGGFTQFNGVSAPFLARLNGGENIGSGVLEFSQTNFNVSEFAGNAVISVVRFGGASNQITVPYATTTNLSALVGTDYTPTNGVLTFQPGETLKTFVVAIKNDTLLETNELVGLQLGAPTGGATLGVVTNATLTIVEDDGVVGYASMTFVANENVGLATVAVARTGGSAGSVTVGFSTANGTAVSSGPNPDYVATNGTLTFGPGETNKTFQVAILNDALIEVTETIALYLTNLTGAAVLGQATANLIIVDNDLAAGVFTLAEPAYQTNESGGSVTVTVIRTNGTTGAASINLSTVGGTATPDVDYVPVNTMLTFADGESVKSVPVFILDDQIAEPTETVNLQLSNPTGGAGLGAITNAVLSIVDEDTSFEFSAPNYLVIESTVVAVITVNRVGSNVVGATVRARTVTTPTSTAVPDVDYLPVVDKLLTFDPGNASQSFTVVLFDDQMIETNETFGLELVNPTGATLGPQSTSQVTIVDDDNAISFTDANYTTNEASTFAIITLLRVGNVGSTSAVTYAVFNGTATNGLDFVGTTNTVTFAPGETNQSFQVDLLPDTVVEGNETINLALFSATNGAFVGALSNATLTIIDDDVAGSLQLSSSTYLVGESDGFATITVLRTNGTSGSVSANFSTADVTAISTSTNADYVATNGVVVFADGETNRTFQVQILGDTTVEVDETVLITLSNPAGGATLGALTNAILTITNEDFFGTLQFTSTDFTVTEGSAFASVTVSRAGGSGGAVSVNFATTSGTAKLGFDYTATNGVLSWTNGDAADKTIQVAIANDNIGEANETVILTLSSPTGGSTLGSPSAATLTIIDDDRGVSFSSSAYTVSEAVGSAVVTVNRLGVATGAVSVAYGVTGGSATPGMDYTVVSGSLSWADGDLSPKTFTVPIINDVLIEGDETIALTLSNAVGASLSSPFETILTVVDDDSSTTFLPAGAVLLSESGGVTNGVIDPGETVTLSLALLNVGVGNSVSLVGTLLNSNGVTPVTLSTNYGVVIAGGPSVARNYTFLASGTNGGTITAILQLQDGVINHGAVPFVFSLGARTAKFANTNAITINDISPASLYPSTINVSGVVGNVSRLTVTLSNLSHSYPADIDILLVSPTGQKMILMADCGSSPDFHNPVNGVILTFDDAAATSLTTNQIVTSTNKPTNLSGPDSFPAPAPAGPYGSTLVVFDGSNPNGVWSLYINDDVSGDAGILAGGWCLNLIEAARVNPLGDLAVTVTDAPDPAVAGRPVTYTLTVTNAGSSTANNVVLTNTLPSGLSYAAITNLNGTFYQTGNTVIFQLGTIAANGIKSVTAVANTVAPGMFSDTATVTSTLTDSSTANNSATAVTTVFAAADVGITLVDSPDPVVVGTDLLYRLVITNRGPSTATGVVVTNTLPAGVTNVTVVFSQGSASQAGGVVTANVGSLASGAGATVTITVQPTALGTVTDSSTVTAGETDLNPADNLASVKTTVISQPALTQVVSGGSLTLSWPSSASNFVLEFTDSISPTIIWVPMPMDPSVVGGSFSVTIPIGPLTTNRFYQLRQVP